jgi:hypothetical protein
MTFIGLSQFFEKLPGLKVASLVCDEYSIAVQKAVDNQRQDGRRDDNLLKLKLFGGLHQASIDSIGTEID